MELILKSTVRNLGFADDVVKVKPGYARNYLIPQGLAILATEANRKSLVEKKKQAAHKTEHLKTQAETLAASLSATKVTIETLAGADGKLFGTVTAIAVANKLKDAGFDVDRRTIHLEEIRHVGEYTATIHLHREVNATVAIEVVRKQD